MSWNRIKRLSFLIMGVAFLGVSGVNAADLCSNIFNAVSIPFQLHNGGIVISVQINDYGQPLNFLLDTGDEKTIVDEQISHELGLPIDERKVTVLKPEAEDSATLVHVRSLRVGSLTLPAQTVISHDPRGLSQALGVHLDGILGLDVLEQLRFKIDYSNTTVTLCPAAKDSEDPVGSVVQLIRSGRSFLLPVTFNASIQDLLLLDTGSNFMNLSWNAWERITQNWHPTRIIRGMRASGEAEPQSHLTRLDSLQIGKFRLSRPATVATKQQGAGAFAQAGASGLIGYDVLKQFILTIDLTHNQLFLRPDPQYHPDPLRYTTIGIQVQTQGTTFLVASVWEDSPASEAGIRAGDEILEIDGEPLAPGLLEPLSGYLLHRPEGTTIRLQLRRGGRTFDRSLMCRDLLP